MVEPEDVAAKRTQLAAVEKMLAKLGGQYDLAMSAFKFDEARELFARIEAAERERRLLARNLPPLPAAIPPVRHSRLLPLRRRRRR